MAKEKQSMMVDLEIGTCSEGFRDPGAPNQVEEVILDPTAQKAKVSATTRPDSRSESEIPGLWSSWIHKEYCCIYRVPNRLRKQNPEAYTPQALLIGPLHHSKKAEALELSKTDSRYLEYMNMENHKKKYLDDLANLYGDQTIVDFRRIIERDEHFIRNSYAESTDWINSQEFVEMILLDSVFILVFFLQTGTQNFTKKGDILFEMRYLTNTVLEDLILLENQLPFVLLEDLFEPFFLNLKFEETFRDTILRVFRFEKKLEREVRFRHFTDLFRRVRVATLGWTEDQVRRAKAEPSKSIKSLQNADKLYRGGVDFVNVNEEKDLSLVIDFEDGILKMPCFIADDNTERNLRNLMALEQCHYPLHAFVCNYIDFLDFLLETEQDVDLLIEKGIVKNFLTSSGSVKDLVEKLCLQIVDYGSHYYHIAKRLKEYNKNSYKEKGYYINLINRSLATLRQVYFKDLWTGTATVGAVIIVVLTLIGTVASVLQVRQNNNNCTKSMPSPPPTQKS